MASRRYGLILDLIDMLPRTSQTRAKMEDDEEYVDMVREAYLKNDKAKDPPSGPPLNEWSALQDQVADLIDEIRMLQGLVTAVGGGKPGRPKPYNRPQTAMNRMSESARIEKRMAKHQRLVDALVPNK